MDRTELQQLAELRLKDAEVLLAASRWGAAYYLLGYCVECGLKACIAKQFHLHEVPDKSLVNSFYTHKLELLLNLSGIKFEKEKQASSDAAFAVNWNTVNRWSEDERYKLGTTEATALDMYEAVTNVTSGVLPWLRTQW